MTNDNLAFDALVDDFLRETWQQSPISATFSGIHEYDSLLDHLDMGSRRHALSGHSRRLKQLEEFSQAGLIDADRQLDLELLKAHLKKELASATMFNLLEQDPCHYPGTAVFSCLIFIMRDFQTKEERYRSLISRLMEIPRFLAEAKENLQHAERIPPLWVEMGQELTQNGQAFFTQLITHTATEIPILKNDMMAAATLASKAFDDYSQFLLNDVSQRATGNWACGKEYFNFLLKEYHLLPFDIEELEKIGLEFIEKTQAEIKKVAALINPNADARELIGEIKSDVPLAEELLNVYRREVDRSRHFILENDLVSLPEGDDLEVIETPPTERVMLPYAAYMAPAPFETSQRGFFWVTPINLSADRERIKEQLSGHNHAAIEVRTLHEGYPGHHLQLCVANRLPSKIRRIFGSSVFVEGWALYCEEMMKDKGYYTSSRTDLIQLKDQLWRACRVVIDIRLHTGRISFDDAIGMLTHIACLERSSAVAEVRRYTQNPTQPLSYLIGKIQILDLARQFQIRFPEVSLKEFHNRLLSFGASPVKLIGKAMLGTK